MATPRVKRALAGQATDPAQRPITSFFARDENAASPFDRSERSSRSPSHSHEISSPLLPPSVQANLLAVGMRVRKSVPEGYKTGKETNERSTPAHYHPQPKAPSTYASQSKSTSSYKSFLQSAGRPAETQSTTAQRELLPFCGLNKIGGMDVQSYHDDRPMFASSLFGGMDDDATVVAGDMEPPSLTSSQETVSSTASMPVYAAKKRFLGDEEDVNVHDDLKFQSRAVPFSTSSSINAWLQDGPVSPRTQAPVLHMGRRVLAVPRRRQQNRSPSVSAPAASESPKLADGQLPSSGASVRVYDQENVGDFDEADFLDDMEMGGM